MPNKAHVCGVYLTRFIFSTFAISFSWVLIIHASSGGAVARQPRSKRGRNSGKYALVRFRGRGGNCGKLVSVVEREQPKQCTFVFLVELGGASIRDKDGGNM